MPNTNDYNPAGGSSWQVIDDYHRQMADIDRQLLETGKYVGPALDPKTGEVTVRELNKKEARYLKNILWQQADELEGYAWRDSIHGRDIRTVPAQLWAFFLRGLRSLSPIYWIRRLIATMDYRKAQKSIYARDAMYDNMQESMKKAPAKDGKEKDKDGFTYEPTGEENPNPKKDHSQDRTGQEPPAPPTPPSRTPENADPVPQKDPAEQKAEYQARFYADLEKFMQDSGLTKEQALVEMTIQKLERSKKHSPMICANIKPEDMTKAVATQLVVAYAKMTADPEKGPNAYKAFKSLALANSAIAKADTNVKEMAGAKKAIASIVAFKPDTLMYFQPDQVSTEYVMKVLNKHAQQGNIPTSDVVNAFIAQVSEIQSPAAQQLLDQYTNTPTREPDEPTPTAPTPENVPVPPPAPEPVPENIPTPPVAPPMPEPEPNMPEPDTQPTQVFDIVQNIMDSDPLIMSAPEGVRASMALAQAVKTDPQLYMQLPEGERLNAGLAPSTPLAERTTAALQLAGIAIAHDPNLIYEAPEELGVDFIADAAVEYMQKEHWSREQVENVLAQFDVPENAKFLEMQNIFKVMRDSLDDFTPAGDGTRPQGREI